MFWNHWPAERLGVACAVLAALGTSFKAIFVKLAYASAPVEAITLLTLRMSFLLPVVLWMAAALWRSAPRLSGRDWALLVALGLLGNYAASILDFIGLQYITAALERLILFTYPTLTVLIGVLFMGKRLTAQQLAALLLSYAGIGLAFAHDLRLAGSQDAVLLGAGFVFASAVSYALYSVGSEVAVHRFGTLRFGALAMIVSTLATQLHFLLSQPLTALQQPLPVYGYAGAMALFSTLLPVFWQSAAVRRIGAARAVLIGTAGPILTIVLGWLLLGEPMSLAQLAGAALVLAGVGLMSRRARPATAAD